MCDFFKLYILLLVGLHTFSAADDECPEDVCAVYKPTVDGYGRIRMTVWYDNDVEGDSYQWNTNMVVKACEAIDCFKDKLFVEFVVGAGTTTNDDNELNCKHDCTADRLEGCAAMLLGCWKFTQFVCCNNNGGTAHECAQNLGLDPAILNNCADNKKSDQFLIYNGDRRRRAGIPGCHVPEFAFNDVVDRCIKIPTSDDLKSAICDIFDRGDVSVESC